MTDSAWKTLFRTWPDDLPRRGVLVTTFAEQAPFCGFMVGDDLIFFERTTPDPLGGRAFILPYGQIAAIKLTDVVKPKSLRAAGFDADPRSRGGTQPTAQSHV